MKLPKFSPRQRNILLLSLGIAAAMGLYCIAALWGWGLPCLFYQLTGLLCPGCGNSRAALALLRLDLSAAFSCNLLFPLEFFYILWVYAHCCKAYLKGKRFSYQPPCPVMDIIVLVAIVIWGVVRNLL